MNPETLNQTLLAIDKANSKDPNLELDPEGSERPKELLYSERMTTALMSFSPEASPALQVAARAQHIERWVSPRSDFPEGRSGYKKWRSQLLLRHAARAGECMTEAGANEDEIERVKYLIQKRQLKKDLESQTLEDVVCLVFLEHYLVPFAAKHPEDKLIDIIQKTWKKMSESGQKAALELPLPDSMLALVSKALAA